MRENYPDDFDGESHEKLLFSQLEFGYDRYRSWLIGTAVVRVVAVLVVWSVIFLRTGWAPFFMYVVFLGLTTYVYLEALIVKKRSLAARASLQEAHHFFVRKYGHEY